jgi:hypothetical protein
MLDIFQTIKKMVIVLKLIVKKVIEDIIKMVFVKALVI